MDETQVGGGFKSFYRIARRFPPGDREYLSYQARRGDPPEDLPRRIKDSWDALSAFESEEAARAVAAGASHLGKWIVRYDVPADSEITSTYTPEIAPGHWDLRGDMEELKSYLVADFIARV